MSQRITRRRFVGLGVAGAAATALSGLPGLARAAGEESVARLRARPGKPTRRAEIGQHNLGLAKGRDGILSVPPGYKPEKPVPLILMLHGALGRGGLELYCEEAAKVGIAVAVPDSRGRTWDLMLGGYGPDIDFLNRVLEHTFASVAVDPRRLAVAGFSDGGSYALSIGLPNGDLFTHIIAHSPGYMMPPSRKGKPGIFITHGTEDNILAIDSSSRRMVPQLRQWGYSVQYKEFSGGHFIPQDLGRESLRWVAGG
jgi:phospholipase/carboxylesterase